MSPTRRCPANGVRFTYFVCGSEQRKVPVSLNAKGVMDNFYGGKGVRDEFLSSTKLLDFVPDTILIFL
jgi:hypothetical protein